MHLVCFSVVRFCVSVSCIGVFQCCVLVCFSDVHWCVSVLCVGVFQCRALVCFNVVHLVCFSAVPTDLQCSAFQGVADERSDAPTLLENTHCV